MDSQQSEAATNESENIADKLMLKSWKCTACELHHYFCYPEEMPETCDRCGSMVLGSCSP
jgi:hypothetical protein